MNRRKFLMVVGGGAILAAGGAATGFLATRTPEKALAPWKLAGSGYTEHRMRALSYAILAPNPHNQQPWKVDLKEDGVAKIFVDTDRLLPHTDPFSRQITIGFGCFLEILRIAAANDGYAVDTTHFPEGFDNEKLDARPLAIVRFKKQATTNKDPLFDYVLKRRSLKEPYDLTRPVSGQVLEGLQSVVAGGVKVDAANKADQVERIRELTHKAMVVEMKTPRTYKESVDLFRIGKEEIEKNPDGLTFSGPFFETIVALGMFSREAALDMSSSAYQQGLDIVLKQIDTAMGHIWLTTEGNTRIDQLNAGRSWVRINLAATKLGVGVHPLSQCLQEYDEMKSHYQAARNMLAPEGGTIQMLGRLGYAGATPPKPRWRIEEKVIKG